MPKTSLREAVRRLDAAVTGSENGDSLAACCRLYLHGTLTDNTFRTWLRARGLLDPEGHLLAEEARAMRDDYRAELDEREGRRAAALRGLTPDDGAMPSVPEGFEVKSRADVLDADGRLRSRSVRIGQEHGEEFAPPEGHEVRGVSALVNPSGEVIQQWVKTRVDPRAAHQRVQLEALAAALKAELGPFDPAPEPEHANRDLLVHLTLTDAQIGRLATPEEGGGVWKLKEAERVLCQCFDLMLRTAPRAHTAVVCFLGDTMEYDGLMPVTAESGHVLNVDGRFHQMVETTYRVQRYVLQCALERFKRVVFVDAEGNHDRAATIQRRAMWRLVYADEPRFSVLDNALPFYGMQHGEVGLFYHHGDKIAGKDLVMAIAAEFASIWGQTRTRVIHKGHEHHRDDKEYRGAEVNQHPTLAARSAFEARGGLGSIRRARLQVYHRRFGEIENRWVYPDMIAAPQSADTYG